MKEQVQSFGSVIRIKQDKRKGSVENWFRQNFQVWKKYCEECIEFYSFAFGFKSWSVSELELKARLWSDFSSKDMSDYQYIFFIKKNKNKNQN